MVGDLPFADVAPPENVLFVCKLNSVTTSEDLELIFSRFGKIYSCEIIRDQKTGDSLQYAFIEFAEREDAERAYLKMDNVLIDDRRIHVDFSQVRRVLVWVTEMTDLLSPAAECHKTAQLVGLQPHRRPSPAQPLETRSSLLLVAPRPASLVLFVLAPEHPLARLPYLDLLFPAPRRPRPRS